MKKEICFILLALLLVGSSILATGCEAPSTTLQTDEKVQEEILSKGQTTVPVHRIDNFLSRKTINRWLERVDTPEKLWYVYIMADSGAFIGYYISDTIPLSYGVSITNPSRIVDWDEDEYVIPAPGLDGVFYQGVDETAWYFFCAETGAMVTTNMKVTFLDQPLDIPIPQLKVKVD